MELAFLKYKVRNRSYQLPMKIIIYHHSPTPLDKNTYIADVIQFCLSPAECDIGWILHNRNCFLMSNNETADWRQAVTSCEMTGANLADLSQENELSFLSEKSMSSESSSKW